MVGELTGDTLLGDDEIGLHGDDSFAQGLDLLLLDLKNAVPVVLLCDLNVGLRLALLVLQGAVQEHDSGVLDAPAHLGVCDVLVQHQAVKDLAVLNLATRNLLNSGISLDVDLSLAVASLPRHRSDGLEGKGAHLVHPPRNKLGADGRRDELVHGLVVVDIDGLGDLVDDDEGVF